VLCRLLLWNGLPFFKNGMFAVFPTSLLGEFHC
jgi:hypothetical protein